MVNSDGSTNIIRTGVDLAVEYADATVFSYAVPALDFINLNSVNAPSLSISKKLAAPSILKMIWITSY